jgi:uncharacterized protein YbaR (Trm112 family)
MKEKLLEIVACPVDKHFPLEMTVFSKEGDDIKEGILVCTKCGRWYPIKDSVPELLPDKRRDPAADGEFISKYRNALPKEVAEKIKLP